VMTGVILNALAQILLKAGANRLGDASFSWAGLPELGWRIATIWQFLLGFGFYGISVAVWIAALTRVPVTIAYPMLSIGYILNALIARFWLGESLSLSGWSGIALICVGVWLIGRHG
jgi:multidrug transporter EmrE-like cation transporter